MTSAPDASREVLAGIAADVGVVPNFAATVAESPALLTGFDGLRRAVAMTDPVSREIAGLAVGVAVANCYGVAFHSWVLGRLGVPEGEVEKMRKGVTPEDPKWTAVYGFARGLVIGRGRVDDQFVRRCEEAGLSAAQILDLVAECAFASLVGLVDNLAG